MENEYIKKLKKEMNKKEKLNDLIKENIENEYEFNYLLTYENLIKNNIKRLHNKELLTLFILYNNDIFTNEFFSGVKYNFNDYLEIFNILYENRIIFQDIFIINENFLNDNKEIIEKINKILLKE